MENKSGGDEQAQSPAADQPVVEKPNLFGSDLPALQPISSVGSGVVLQPKKRKWPFIVAGALIVAIVGVATSYFLIVDGANRAADNYASSLNTYLDKTYENLIVEGKTLAEIKDENAKLDKPKLADASLGSLSSKYSDAKILMTNANSRINDLETAINGYIAVNNFEKVAIEAVADMQSLQPAAANESGVNYLKAIQTSVVKIQSVANENISNVPDDLKSNFEVISSQYNNMVAALSDLIDAYEKNDDALVTTALNKYYATVEANSDSSSAGAIATYYNNLDTKYDASVSTFKEYIDSF